MAEPGFECPECGTKLSSKARCMMCGWKRGASAEPKGDPDRAQCRFLSVSSWRCPLAASWFPNGGEHAGACSWHSEVMKNPRLDTFEEFERWCEYMTASRYCTIWSHHRPGDLYDYMAGKIMRAPTPYPCDLLGCPYRVVDESPEAIATIRKRITLGGETGIRL